MSPATKAAATKAAAAKSNAKGGATKTKSQPKSAAKGPRPAVKPTVTAGSGTKRSAKVNAAPGRPSRPSSATSPTKAVSRPPANNRAPGKQAAAKKPALTPKRPDAAKKAPAAKTSGVKATPTTQKPTAHKQPMQKKPDVPKAGAKQDRTAPAAARPQKKSTASHSGPQKSTRSHAGGLAAISRRTENGSAPRELVVGPYASDEKFLAEQRRLLESERAVYVGQAHDLRAEAESLAQEREPGDVQFDEESGEGGTVTVDRERDLALSAQALAAVEEIDAALARIEDGTYGACERCHQPIPKPRLKALPFARLCVACKSGGLSRR